MERLTKAKEILVRSWRTSCNSISRMVDWLVGITRNGCLNGAQAIGLSTASVLLISCTTLKKAGVTAIAAGGGATVASVLSSGVAAPILGGMTGAFVGDVATEVMIKGSSKGVNMDSCAPDNFWTLLGDLASMGGWLLILVILIPMVLGWFLPGPVKLKRKDKQPHHYIPSGYK